MSRFQLLIPVFALLVSCKSAQLSTSDEQLYNHVDSLITQVLKFEYTEDSLEQPTTIADTTQVFTHLHYNIPKNPEPRILLDGLLVNKRKLKNYTMDDIRTLEIMEPSDGTSALFGSMGKNGAVIITTTKFKRQK